MDQVKRIFVEKKPSYGVRGAELREEVVHYLNIKEIDQVRVLVRYDIENLSEETYKKALYTVFSEPPVDVVYEEIFPYDQDKSFIFSVEYLPGQFDQRADSAQQCLKLLNENEEPVVKAAMTYVFQGNITQEQKENIKSFCINPVDSREAGMEKPDTLIVVYDEPEDVKIIDNLIGASEEKVKELYHSLSLAMTFQDFLHIKNYFENEEKRNPSMTEIRVLDTYWSDHCRHTTFQTELTKVKFQEGYYKKPIEDTYYQYLKDREEIFKGRSDKFVCLMDLALMAMRKLKKEGKLNDQEESDEINACSIVVPVEIDGVEEEWLVNFKNETHNHPTEIEPFGGAATCLGGAIRDPLSGRTYVYQAMRVTGAADPTTSIKDTLKGKLPQKKIVREAAHGYSSYGNQIGLATGHVEEIYHPNYVAKRMEIGAVIGAAPRRAVKRLNSDPGDIIVLLGGRTGRDGCGGATGSSKVHTEDSIEECGAEVQKGNAPTERKIQRLFFREEVSRLIKKCNDFGAGGVSVAIGELADGLRINLDHVPKKYAGLDGTELSISESQERMAVVLDPSDVKEFMKYVDEENLEAVEVAIVTQEPRLVISWKEKEIVNISRAFLDTNGAHQEAEVEVEIPSKEEFKFRSENPLDIKENWLKVLSSLNGCSSKGLVEMFDSSIGAGSVLMPFGGKYQLTKTQGMVAKLPVLKGNCDTVTMMSYGFDPYLSSWSPYHGAIYAVMDSVAKIVSMGGDYKKIRFTFQEYFKRMSEDPKSWGQPFAALLGAYNAQIGLGLPSIGGKDSMSGTFNEIEVPPTLVSFAVNTGNINDIISPELKEAGNILYKFDLEKDTYDLPVYEKAMEMYDNIFRLIQEKVIVSAYVPSDKGLAYGIASMAFGNMLGVELSEDLKSEDLFAKEYGNIIVEVPKKYEKKLVGGKKVGVVTESPILSYSNVKLSLQEAIETWKGTLEKVFPSISGKRAEVLEDLIYEEKKVYICKNKIARPTVFIPIFPGTNCEYDSAKAFEKSGAAVVTKVFKNLNPQHIRDSVETFKKAIDQSQIIMFPGGFSAGDEPDGSAKFFATVFRNQVIQESIHDLLNKKDGLILGICNGFQAMIKLGLVPFGEIKEQHEEAPTLTFNTINRHISKMVYTKVVSNKSPWLSQAELGKVYVNPASHGEGRFVASTQWIEKLFENGQIATRYTDIDGHPVMDEEWNVNGSFGAIEGITSPDGRCFGKMVHIERNGYGIAKNIYGDQDMKVFTSGVKYFL